MPRIVPHAPGIAIGEWNSSGPRPPKLQLSGVAVLIVAIVVSYRYGRLTDSRIDSRHKVRIAMSRASAVYPDIRAAAAFGAAAVSCEEAASRELSWTLPANILLILRPRSAGVKGFWMSDTPGINMSARTNSPL